MQLRELRDKSQIAMPLTVVRQVLTSIAFKPTHDWGRLRFVGDAFLRYPSPHVSFSTRYCVSVYLCDRFDVETDEQLTIRRSRFTVLPPPRQSPLTRVCVCVCVCDRETQACILAPRFKVSTMPLWTKCLIPNHGHHLGSRVVLDRVSYLQERLPIVWYSLELC